MQVTRKMFLKQAVLTVTLAGLCLFSACEKQTTKSGGGGALLPPGAPGACSDTWANYCDGTNTCSSGTCTVNVMASGSGATAKIQGQNPVSPKDKYICVAQGASLQWQSPNSAMGSPNQFIGDFAGLSPWQSARAFVAGGGTTSDTEAANTVQNKCYKYTLYVCNSAIAPSLTVSCGVDDPKIIIGNP